MSIYWLLLFVFNTTLCYLCSVENRKTFRNIPHIIIIKVEETARPHTIIFTAVMLHVESAA